MFGLRSGASLQRNLAQYLEKPLTGLFLTAGLVVTAYPRVLAENTTLPTQPLTPQTIGSLEPETAGTQSLADGTYLYGQAPVPEQIGSAYMVFQVEQGEVQGAFYMPRSSFDCFYGSFQGNQLALTVVNSYEQTHYPYAIALERQEPVATIGNDAVAPIGLQGFHQLESPSANDLRILSACQVNN